MIIRTYQNVVDNKKKNSVGGGTHPFYEILCITSGEVTLEFMNESFRSVSRTLFLIPDNIPHQLYKQSDSAAYWYLELEKGAGSLTEVASFLSVSDAIAWNRIQSGDEALSSTMPGLAGLIGSTVDSIAAAMSNDSLSRQSELRERIVLLDVNKLFLQITAALQQHRQLDTATPELAEEDPNKQLVQDLMHYMENAYLHEVKLQMLASRAHLASSYLIRLFKTHTGTTPYQYLQELRMNAAKSYLTNTSMTVKDIAETNGFPSIHYFSRQFKKRYGMSPSRWRQAQEAE
ncbi:AraC family transcriptional regulator [Paenibacillus hodogayensis]|uniref:AraC family transcriptional regulator n=1 Tax=Paenibacillus hodogayensis TaxID=279208 RepID=A0ABV5VPP4_9BACL